MRLAAFPAGARQVKWGPFERHANRLSKLRYLPSWFPKPHFDTGLTGSLSKGARAGNGRIRKFHIAVTDGMFRYVEKRERPL